MTTNPYGSNPRAPALHPIWDQIPHDMVGAAEELQARVTTYFRTAMSEAGRVTQDHAQEAYTLECQSTHRDFHAIVYGLVDDVFTQFNQQAIQPVQNGSGVRRARDEDSDDEDGAEAQRLAKRRCTREENPELADVAFDDEIAPLPVIATIERRNSDSMDTLGGDYSETGTISTGSSSDLSEAGDLEEDDSNPVVIESPQVLLDYLANHAERGCPLSRALYEFMRVNTSNFTLIDPRSPIVLRGNSARVLRNALAQIATSNALDAPTAALPSTEHGLLLALPAPSVDSSGASAMDVMVMEAPRTGRKRGFDAVDAPVEFDLSAFTFGAQGSMNGDVAARPVKRARRHEPVAAGADEKYLYHFGHPAFRSQFSE